MTTAEWAELGRTLALAMGGGLVVYALGLVVGLLLIAGLVLVSTCLAGQ